MKIGYARVSTDKQVLDLQTDALKDCDQVFCEQISGASDEKPELAKALAALKKGDFFVVWRLDRAGRSAVALMQLAEDLKRRGVHFKSVTEGIDTSSPMGEFIYTIFAAYAQFERSLIRERVMAGLESARAKGRIGGRPKVDVDLNELKALICLNKYTADELCNRFEISRATYYRLVKKVAA
jgi:DNA invertase Pin-like site-specific DNA recombinase